MNRFEAEISSLTRQPNFIPAQLRRPMHVPSGPPVISAPPLINRPPAPVIISAAPQKYPTSEQQPTKAPSAPVLPVPQVPIIRPIIPTQIPSAFPQISHIRPMGGLLPMSIPQPPMAPMTNVGVVGPGITPVLPGSSNEAPKPGPSTDNSGEKQKKKKKSKKEEKSPKKNLRCAGGQIWEDGSLADWDPSDFRLFCGDLGNDVTDEVLTRVFGRYPSFVKAKVIRDKRTNKTKGYGFVSFKDPNDFVRAIRELDGRYVGKNWEAIISWVELLLDKCMK
ncbi:unnamed protein product [Allacma fusca]|uniref:RNA-binding protein 42 n=1 Tax=Allacma fusca TaxID=39272 RepID=A0A8J2LHU0_9HEXA|nr:unnamed protein product [Allacma fusca]